MQLPRLNRLQSVIILTVMATVIGVSIYFLQAHQDEQHIALPVKDPVPTESATNTPAPTSSQPPAPTQATPTPSPKPTSTKPTSSTSAASSTPTTGTKTTTAPTSFGNCFSPYFTTSKMDDGVTDGGYYVHNNLWNAAKYPGTTGTTQVCSYHSWNHTAFASNSSGNGEVKTYPNVHKDYSGRTISSFSTLSSTFAAISPSVGIYDVAYDLWLNGVPNDEIMIWTDNYNQVPAGSRLASNVSVGGYSWNVYATDDNGYIAFVPAGGARLKSGNINIKAMLDYLVSQGRRSAGDTVDQIGYGIEIIDTGGASANWYVTDFSISNN